MKLCGTKLCKMMPSAAFSKTMSLKQTHQPQQVSKSANAASQKHPRTPHTAPGVTNQALIPGQHVRQRQVGFELPTVSRKQTPRPIYNTPPVPQVRKWAFGMTKRAASGHLWEMPPDWSTSKQICGIALLQSCKKRS